ncbi:biopolymer transporter ExbD [Erythrobacter sp. F6033]|uniref:ExbD/TolR family protein n=1 Tax=Erythrobacter sp. F6033 TaxID=2926401 RepID=UPI001FF473EE|nr:biopolymer transporter ExbD [Erythrobacter sp. F6033]
MTSAAPTRRSRFSESANARRHAAQTRITRRQPKGDMNVTPFIDVLLVLLVMIILAVPIKVNQTTVDLPTTPCFDCEANPDINVVAITAQDELLWNGTSVTPARLRAEVENASTAVPEAQLRFEPDALASYDRSARTIALIRESGAESFAFVGNARHREFGR